MMKKIDCGSSLGHIIRSLQLLQSDYEEDILVYSCDDSFSRITTSIGVIELSEKNYKIVGESEYQTYLRKIRHTKGWNDVLSFCQNMLKILSSGINVNLPKKLSFDENAMIYTYDFENFIYIYETGKIMCKCGDIFKDEPESDGERIEICRGLTELTRTIDSLKKNTLENLF